ncbi:PaaX family transcriptional regulator C-terminal domain-containing protein [Streptomyces coeruleorubidus]|uniref:Transcriptional regulator n=1 Tax=Streptomyces coeruleorubidus TaxID=116188 RepID=A0A5J6IGF6_STRC4|nr:PaaX family transcriptional regulator C-terminal domain-containing protein [Streptomyces coeruleorubidus]QEV29930.1 transcriptional regulator [Streptomyces coeruleorubidus]GGT83872.1 putative repressor in the phenylacetic acid catabolism [Streptomyces coeruleorubidus]
MTDHVEIPTRMLVHALIREDGTVSADELYTVAATLGMSDQQVRLCVKRLVAESRFTHEGRGRKAVLHATEATIRSLAPNADFLRHAFRQDAGLAPWDDVWHLAAFAVPESARTARDALRETLVHLGGAPLQGGLYVCANAWEPYVEDAAHRLGAHSALTLLSTTDLRRGDTREPAELARHLWPLQEIANRYHHLSRIAQPRLDRLTGSAGLSPSELLTIAVELAAELTRAMEPDPLLPPQLLPQPWPGTQARELIARCWAALPEHDHGEARPTLFRLYADITREAADRATR